jgi:hypothetical protein
VSGSAPGRVAPVLRPAEQIHLGTLEQVLIPLAGRQRTAEAMQAASRALFSEWPAGLPGDAAGPRRTP